MSVEAPTVAARLDRNSVAAALRSYWAGHPSPVVAAYLFGSVARGQAREGSDVDVAILCDPPPPATLEGVPHELETDLTRVLGAPVQVVVLNRAPVDLVHRVLRDGILVCERDRSRRIAFEVRARNLHWDMLPVLRRYRRGKTVAA